jgi:hypothetical protein
LACVRPANQISSSFFFSFDASDRRSTTAHDDFHALDEKDSTTTTEASFDITPARSTLSAHASACDSPSGTH